MSKGKKIVLFSLIFFFVGIMYLGITLPKLVDPSEQLVSVAKRVASGPRSPEDAKNIREAFNLAIKNFLSKHGSENSADLAKRLKLCLPAAAFEVLVVDLPKAMKLVEVDTVLNASDFLVMKGTNETKVIPLPEFEIYDDARAVNDGAGAVLVLLGHTGGQPPHRPMVRSYAILPDSVVDETATMVPALGGEGTAHFNKDGTEIDLELSLNGIAQAEKIAMQQPLVPDRNIRMKLKWKDAKYIQSIDFPQDLEANMLLLARALKYPDLAGPVTAALGAQAGKLMKEHASPDMKELSIKKNTENKKSISYSIEGPSKKLNLELKRAGNSLLLAGYQVELIDPLAAQKVSANGAKNSAAGQANLALESGDKSQTELSDTSKSAETSKHADNQKSAQNNSLSTKSASTPDASQTKAGGTNTKSVVPDIMSSLKPERAGRNSETTNKTAQTEQKSSWLDGQGPSQSQDGQKNKNIAVAALPPGLNTSSADKEKAEKERLKKEKAEREKAAKEAAQREKSEREKAEKEKKERDKLEQDKQNTAASGGSARIADNLGTNSVRMRSGPGLNMRTLTEIPKGTKITILGENKGWYKVSWAGQTGYVFGPLVDRSQAGPDNVDKAVSKQATNQQSSNSKPSGSQAPSSQQNTASHVKSGSAASSGSGGGGAVVVRGMTLRDERRRAISTVKVGQQVTLLSGLENNRYKIRTAEGTVGYVYKDALDVKVETPPEFVP